VVRVHGIPEGQEVHSDQLARFLNRFASNACTRKEPPVRRRIKLKAVPFLGALVMQATACCMYTGVVLVQTERGVPYTVLSKLGSDKAGAVEEYELGLTSSKHAHASARLEYHCRRRRRFGSGVQLPCTRIVGVAG
jgi:hypothetical protein